MDYYFLSQDYPKIRDLIDTHDFDPIMERLIKVYKWSKKHALEACYQYRNYIFLKKKYGESYELPPSYEIDEFWHAHILHTEDYKEFCEKIFGFFLHHHPHHGKGNEISQSHLEKMFEEQTQQLYYKETGDYIYAIRPQKPFKFSIARSVRLLFTLRR